MIDLKVIEKKIKLIEPGDVLFFKPVTALERFVAGVAGVYSHVGLGIGHNSPLFISSRWYRGIDYDDLRDYKHDFDIYKIKGITGEERDHLIRFAIAHRGMGYDKLRITSYIFTKKLFTSPSRYICVEYVAHCLISIGRVVDRDPEKLLLIDLANQDFLQKVDI